MGMHGSACIAVRIQITVNIVCIFIIAITVWTDKAEHVISLSPSWSDSQIHTWQVNLVVPVGKEHVGDIGLGWPFTLENELFALPSRKSIISSNGGIGSNWQDDARLLISGIGNWAIEGEILGGISLHGEIWNIRKTGMPWSGST